ncbi:hypothetical protein B0F90DRAFT_1844942 [Multifurca ochricompacta]|uniref:Uncharacterized protein n=1 Tax=Multifurca ochricompacta TaxID=376703 RepID=A0AAD4LXH1_9AGAM|nr:hypothetical protein B0F90DRAFT_1844942 [Multifurca ochricompacta]
MARLAHMVLSEARSAPHPTTEVERIHMMLDQPASLFNTLGDFFNDGAPETFYNTLVKNMRELMGQAAKQQGEAEFTTEERGAYQEQARKERHRYKGERLKQEKAEIDATAPKDVRRTLADPEKTLRRHRKAHHPSTPTSPIRSRAHPLEGLKLQPLPIALGLPRSPIAASLSDYPIALPRGSPVVSARPGHARQSCHPSRRTIGN